MLLLFLKKTYKHILIYIKTLKILVNLYLNKSMHVLIQIKIILFIHNKDALLIFIFRYLTFHYYLKNYYYLLATSEN